MTATEEAKPEPISMGIIVRKTTVHGFDDSQPIFGKKREPAKIIGVTETTISFGEHPIWDGGTIDRVTGDVSATFRAGSVAFPSTTYDLKCQPARRMF
jgi:hypothetical protein